MTGLRRPLRDRRGFTLVELVVVLVILGITASFAVPALTGYIDTSKEKKAVSEAQACVMAATRLGAAQYAKVQQHNVNVSLNSGAGAAKDDSLDSWAPVDGQSAPEITGGDGFIKVVVGLAVGGGAGGEVGAQLVGGSVAVGVLADDGGLGKAGGLGAALLLFGRAAKHQHTGGHHKIRQVQRVPHGLDVLDDVANVAAADAHRFRGDDGVLRGDAGVGHSQHQIARAGLAHVLDACRMVGVQPAAAVGQEHQYQRRFGDERLVVAQVRQRGFQRRVGDIQNRVQLLVARRGCLERCV